jgi:hypothetical protein
MFRNTWPLLAATCLSVGCGDGAARAILPEATAAPVPGAYALTTVGGRALPVDARLGSLGVAVTVEGANLQIEPNGRFAIAFQTNPRYLLTCSGRYDVEGPFIVFRATEHDLCPKIFRGVADESSTFVRATALAEGVAVFRR